MRDCYDITTYHRIFKYLPQVIVIVGGVIIGGGNEPPEVLTVCYVHEDSLQHTGKVQSVPQKFKKSLLISGEQDF